VKKLSFQAIIEKYLILHRIGIMWKRHLAAMQTFWIGWHSDPNICGPLGAVPSAAE
jgi:hypothetical protein